MPFSAVLFDLDGTLINSIPAWAAATRKGLSDCAVEMTDEEHASLAYLALSDCLFAKGHDQTMVDRVCTARDAYLPDLLTELTVWYDDAIDTIGALKHLPTAVVTSAHRAAVDVLHRSLGIRDHFDTFVVWEDVFPRYKPHPYPLQLAAQKLGVNVEDCLYIGDTLPDVRCANNAGATSCQIVRPHAPKEDEAAHHITALSELLLLV